MKQTAYLRMEQCRDGYCYLLDSRNLNLGVYAEKHKAFFGIRHKFGNEFIDNEFHWDTGAPYGTACPIEEICHCPIGTDPSTAETLLKWLSEKRDSLGLAQKGRSRTQHDG